jgi:hypothetical protein
MPTSPARPPFVPATAKYDPELDGWEVADHDATGERRGECKVYRHADGSLYRLARYIDGIAEGPFTVFHPNGQIAVSGAYLGGKLDGEVSAYGSDAPTELSLRSCCVPSSAWELRSRYRHGVLVRQVFYDREGMALAADGSRWPERPAHLAEDADYDEHNRLWLVREMLADGTQLDRHFTVEGRPFQESEYGGGNKTCERAFDDRGRLREERHLDAEGRFHGSSTRWFPDATENPYSDARVRLERGQFWHGQPVGTFTWFDEEGVAIARRELGAGLTPDELEASSALAVHANGSAAEFWALSEELAELGRVREALCAAARAAVRDDDRARLEALLDGSTLRHRPALSEQRGQLLLQAQDVTPLVALDELLLGAQPAAAYRTLAAVLGNARRVALELVEAARLLAPEQRSIHVTRALLRLEMGNPDGVLEDASWIEPDSRPVAEHLRTSVRVFFPTFEFRCDLPDPMPPEASEVEPGQPVETVRHQIGVYATRLGLLRRAILDSLETEVAPAWCPPDLRHLVPEDPIELRNQRAMLTDDTDEGPETVEVTVDETLDLAGLGVTTLMRLARADFAALSWLCWSAGLSTIALPETLVVPPEFSAAVNMALSRCFRAKDQQQSGGLLSRSRGVPSFTWEGIDIGQLDPTFVALAAAEYLEVRSMFLWLLFSENISPFQSDIRSA